VNHNYPYHTLRNREASHQPTKSFSGKFSYTFKDLISDQGEIATIIEFDSTSDSATILFFSPINSDSSTLSTLEPSQLYLQVGRVLHILHRNPLDILWLRYLGRRPETFCMEVSHCVPQSPGDGQASFLQTELKLCQLNTKSITCDCMAMHLVSSECEPLTTGLPPLSPPWPSPCSPTYPLVVKPSLTLQPTTNSLSDR